MKSAISVSLFLLFVATCNVSAQQSDTSSYFPLGFWGIWIDKDSPPYTDSLGSDAWALEKLNWLNANGNYLVYHMPIWMDSLVLTFTETSNYKVDIARSNYGFGSSIDPKSLTYWIRDLSITYNQFTAKVDSLATEMTSLYGSNPGVYSYSLAHERPVVNFEGAAESLNCINIYWPRVRYAVNKLKHLDTNHKTYVVAATPAPRGFVDTVSNLDIVQSDWYVFHDDVPKTLSAQQSALEILRVRFDSTAQRLKGKFPEWQVIIQSQREYRPPGQDNIRRPTREEIRANAYLALTRGSRGTTSFVYGSDVNVNASDQEMFLHGGDEPPFKNVLRFDGLVDENREAFDASNPDPQGVPAYDYIKDLYQELALMGPTIRKSKHYEYFAGWTLQDPAYRQPNIINMDSMWTNYFDPGYLNFIEVGTFKRFDQGPDSTAYFIMVNRVCNREDGSVSGPQSVTSRFNHPTYPWLHITEVVSDREWVIRNSGTFTDTLEPGSGKLYKLENANILNLAKQSKTTSPNATSSNNQRKVVRESSGKLHRVFESADHIFYQRIPNGSTLPDTTIQVSVGATVNGYPCLTERSGYLWITWQRASVTDKWHVLYAYSTNGGNTWSGNIALAFNIQCMSPGPLPVILGGSPSNSFELMVAYRQSDTGVRTRRTTVSPGSTGWSSPITVTGTTGNSMNPSLNYQTNSYAYYRLTWIDGGKIYHSQYYPNTWTNNTFVNSGTWGLVQNEANPSYALTSSNDIHIVWQGKYYGKDIIVANRNLSTVYATFEPSLSSIHYSKPSITGHESGRASAIWQDDLGNVRKAIYDPVSGWYSVGSTIGTGFSPATSIKNTSGGDGRVIWTQGAWSPYTVTLDAVALNKNGGDFDYRRQIILRDTLGVASVSLEFRALDLMRSSGAERIDFIPLDDTLRYTPEQALSLLESKPFDLPSDIQTMTIGRSIHSRNISRIAGQARLRLELVDAVTGSIRHSFGALDLNSTGSTFSVDDSVNFLPTPTTASLKFRVRVDGLLPAALSNEATVVSRYIEETVSQAVHKASINRPVTLSLEQNYPNPFNPTTKIKYQIPTAHLVTLKVFDILGLEIRTLVNEVKTAGEHSVTFDATGLASGVYFYRLTAGSYVQTRKLVLLR